MCDQISETIGGQSGNLGCLVNSLLFIQAWSYLNIYFTGR